MKTNILIFLFGVLFITSCSSNYNVYVSKPESTDSDIFGYKLASFFDKNNSVQKTKIINHKLFEVEMGKVRDSLLKTEPLPLDGEKFGIYKFAFITTSDTLYSNSTLSGWRYKNKVGRYENISPILKTEILNLLK